MRTVAETTLPPPTVELHPKVLYAHGRQELIVRDHHPLNWGGGAGYWHTLCSACGAQATITREGQTFTLAGLAVQQRCQPERRHEISLSYMRRGAE